MKPLKKSKNKKICGVCGGIAEYFDIDPTLVRLIIAILILCGFGTGIIVYFICALILPEADAESTTTKDEDINNLKSANISDEEKNEKQEGHSTKEFNKYFDKE